MRLKTSTPLPGNKYLGNYGIKTNDGYKTVKGSGDTWPSTAV